MQGTVIVSTRDLTEPQRNFMSAHAGRFSHRDLGSVQEAVAFFEKKLHISIGGENAMQTILAKMSQKKRRMQRVKSVSSLYPAGRTATNRTATRQTRSLCMAC